MGLGGGPVGFIGDSIRGGIGLEPTGLPFLGGLFGPSPAEEAQLAQMRAAAAAYQQMRGPAAAARTQALQNVLGGIGGPGNRLAQDVYGGGMDFSLAAQNPVTPELLTAGQPQPANPPPKDAGDKAGEYAAAEFAIPFYGQGKLLYDALGGLF